MIIRNNLSANKAINSLNTSKGKLQKKTTNLSSGKKLNVAADDAAGLAMSNKMNVMIRGLKQAGNNISDGINMISTADGGMADITSIMQRQRELIVSAMNGTHDEVDQQAIKEELDALSAEIDRIANATEFNGIKLLSVPGASGADDSLGFNLDDYYKILNRVNPIADDGKLQFSVKKVSGADSELVYHRQDYGITSTTTFNLTDIATGVSTPQLMQLRSCTTTPTVHDPAGPTWTTTYDFSDGTFDVSINQVVSLTTDANNNEYYNITYDVINNGSNQISLNLLFNVDVMFSTPSGDNPIFSVDGQAGTNITTGTIFSGNNVPGKLDLCDLSDPTLCARIIPDGNNSNPDKVFVGLYSNAQYFDYVGGEDIFDSGYSVLWLDRTIDGGDTSSFSSLYGVVDPKENPEVALLGNNDGTGKVWIQSGAYGLDGQWIDVYDCRADTLEVADLIIDPWDKAEESLGLVDAAINLVSVFRGRSGAQYNSLEAAAGIATAMHYNTQAAESQITSADMAKEICDHTKYNIISNAAQAMLAQANQAPQGVLQLLG